MNYQKSTETEIGLTTLTGLMFQRLISHKQVTIFFR